MFDSKRPFTARSMILAAALLFGFLPSSGSAGAATLAEIIEGAKKEGSFRGQWGQNSFGGSEGFQEILAGMNKKYKLNLKGQYTPGPDMQRLMLRVIQENAAGQPASTDVYLGNAQAIFDGLKANAFTTMTYDKFIESKPQPEGKFHAIAPAGSHVAFAAPSRKSVDEFYAIALSNGARDNGAPGLRPYTPTYYAAFLFDPDGHAIEAVCFEPE